MAAQQEYIHKTLILKCRINSDKLDRAQCTIKNSTNELDKLFSTIKRKFKFLQEQDDDAWTICINSQFIKRNDEKAFRNILSSIPPPVTVNIMWATLKEPIVNTQAKYFITVHFGAKDRQFVHQIYEDKDDWNQETWNNLVAAISKEFNLDLKSFTLYEDVGDNNMVTVDDEDDIKAAFDDMDSDYEFVGDGDEGRQSVHIYVKEEAKDNDVEQSSDEESYNELRKKYPEQALNINVDDYQIDDISDMKSDDDLDWDDMEEIKDDGKHPVLPLIIPNNCCYDAKTGKITVDQSKPRRTLMPYKPALEFIRGISSKIATISIVGKARTGKSLVAGELYAAKKIPCPFDLGHKMDACTYGIWVSAKTIKHPYQKDTVILIFDVEGTGFYEANKHNDMQIMVITLLLSSYFIYNSRGTFDAAALDEIKFVLELTKNIQTVNDNNDGTDFKKYFPIFMWLLRDVFLQPVIDNKEVSIRDYFTQKVLTSVAQSGLNIDKDAMERQFIRQAFIQMFQKYDAYALPSPHGNEKVLRSLGGYPRDKLKESFNTGLDEFVDKVLKDTRCKVLFSKDADGQDQYTHCTGTHLAKWIEQCVKWVNSGKIPVVSSMTDNLMEDVFRETKKKAIKQYKKLLKNKLCDLRKNNDKLPLDENDIIKLHLTIFNKVLNSNGNSLQPTRPINDNGGDDEYKDNGGDDSDFDDDDDDEKKHDEYVNDKPQIKIFGEFCHEIGHNQDIRKIGQRGIMKNILAKNRQLSKVYCEEYLQNYFANNIQLMLDHEEIKKHKAKDMFDRFTKLENEYYKECFGPEKDNCWKRFKKKEMNDSISTFKTIKGITDQLLQTEKLAAKQRSQQKKIEKSFDRKKKELELQQKALSEELARIKGAREIQAIEHEKKLAETEQRIEDMREANFKELAQQVELSRVEMCAKVARMKNENFENLNKMKNKFNKKIKEAIYGILAYTLIFQNPFENGNIANTFDELITDDAKMGAIAQCKPFTYIEANLGAIRFVTHIEIKGIAIDGFCMNGRNAYKCIIQYHNSRNQWITLKEDYYIPNHTIQTIVINDNVIGVRLYSDMQYVCCGTLRIFGSAKSHYY